MDGSPARADGYQTDGTPTAPLKPEDGLNGPPTSDWQPGGLSMFSFIAIQFVLLPLLYSGKIALMLGKMLSELCFCLMPVHGG